MSNDSISHTQKADQIAFHFYTKLFHVVNEARATPTTTTINEPAASQSKVDKWFNLETPDSDLFTKEARDKYKAISFALPAPPPLEIQVILTLPDNHNQNKVLVYIAPDSSRVRIDSAHRHILLEKWVLDFTRDPDSGAVALPTIYKHGIPLFRSLYSLLRIIPAWKLCKRLRSRRPGGAHMTVQLRIKTGETEQTSNLLDFGMLPSANAAPFPHKTHIFPSVPHPMGTLSLSATYLATPNFRLDELESLLSSRFLSLDSGPPEVEFIPTLVKNQQRESMVATGSGLPSSLPIRATLPSSGPRSHPAPARTTTTLTIADRFISTTSSTSASHLAGSTSSSPGPLPIRRPNLNPVHPFKSNTLSSTSSLPLHSLPQSVSQSPRQQSVALPSAGTSPPGVSLANWTPGSLRQQQPPQGSLSSLGLGQGITKFPTASASSATPPSPIGLGRPSSVAEDSAARPPRKRYSSSFGHRYAASGGAGSDGSGSVGSGGGAAGGSTAPGGDAPLDPASRRASASYTFLVGTNSADDEDISMFVQDIDERRPLSGWDRMRQQQGRRRPSQSRSPRTSPRKLADLPLPPLHERDMTIRNRPGEVPATLDAEAHPEMFVLSPDRASRTSPVARGFGMSPPATSEGEVEEKLRKMNEAFMKSLEGLGNSSNSSGSSRRTAAATASSRRVPQSDALGLFSRDIPGEIPGEGSASASASGQGSEEIIGKLEFRR